MFILYVLECMLMIFVEGNAGTGGELILISTKQPMTTEDFYAGFIGWVVLAALIIGTILLIRYLKHRTRLKEKWERQKANNVKERVFTKKELKGWLIVFGCALVALGIGIPVSLFAGGEIAVGTGIFLRDLGLILLTVSVLAPLFRYGWRKLSV